LWRINYKLFAVALVAHCSQSVLHMAHMAHMADKLESVFEGQVKWRMAD
jgi:hypothetical protein